MTEVLQGNSKTLTVTFYEYTGGPVADVDGVTITITNVTDSSVVLGPTSVGVAELSTGIFRYVWEVGSSQAADDYLITWTGTDAQSEEVTASELVTVLPNTDGTWATVTDTENVTGKTVTTAQLQQAQTIVELFSDTTILASDAGNISAKNLRLLKWAVAFQAAWITEHPDVFTNVDLDQFTQDGLSATLGHENASLLAPLARRCIARLSWKRSRSVSLQRPGSTPVPDGNRDSTAYDKYETWKPLGGG